jgi:hypothetical protein
VEKELRAFKGENAVVEVIMKRHGALWDPMRPLRWHRATPSRWDLSFFASLRLDRGAEQRAAI